MKWLKKQNVIVKILLLLIPWNWLTEIIIRWGHMFEKFTGVSFIMAILVLPLGVIIGWIDLVLLLLGNDYLLKD